MGQKLKSSGRAYLFRFSAAKNGHRRSVRLIASAPRAASTISIGADLPLPSCDNRRGDSWTDIVAAYFRESGARLPRDADAAVAADGDQI